MIKPTVGRVVWFFPEHRHADDQPLAAMIARVHSDTCVNLAITHPSGSPMLNPPTSIRLVQEGETPPADSDYCTWMPYQMGQAAKTEQVQSQLANQSGQGVRSRGVSGPLM